MLMSNHEYIGRALGLLYKGLYPYVEKKMAEVYGSDWINKTHLALSYNSYSLNGTEYVIKQDVSALLIVMWDEWNNVFYRYLNQSERTLISELRIVRNEWAHNFAISGKDAYRALDSMTRLLAAISASEVKEVEKLANQMIEILYHDLFGKESSSEGQIQKEIVQLWYEEAIQLSNCGDYNTALIAINKAMDLNPNQSKGNCGEIN